MIDTDKCWRWPGFHRKQDGRPTVKGKYVYRLIYKAATGDDVPSLSLHHTCNNRWCVNPFHLTLLPQGEHVRTHGWGGDWGQRFKTHCRNGHPYDEENTIRVKGRHGTERRCRLCLTANKRRYDAKRKGVTE